MRTDHPLAEVTVISGGGTGMGQEVALRLANSGKRVVIVGRRREPLEATVKLAPADRVDYVVADLGSVEGVKHLVDVLGPHTKVAAIIAAAGGQGEFRHGGQSLEEIDAAWTAALRKNFYSSLLLVEALLDRINEGNGRVVLISSTSALDGRGGPYATAKAALHGYMMDLTQRLAPRSITVNVIAPGYVKQTDFFNAGGYPDIAEMEKQVASRLLLKRVGTPADIASCVLWLLSPEAGWTTGQVISVNGGAIIG
jgi:3-oxoacyl-[acyl-carrier protein] reductase